MPFAILLAVYAWRRNEDRYKTPLRTAAGACLLLGAAAVMLIAILLSLSRQVLFLIPYLIVLPLFWNLDGAWLAGPASDLSASIVTYFVLQAWLQRRMA